MTTTITPECKISYANRIVVDIFGSRDLKFGWHAKKVLGESNNPGNNTRYIGFTIGDNRTAWYKLEKPTYV